MAKKLKHIFNYSIIVILFCVIHYSGVFLHLFELDYERFFYYPVENRIELNSQRQEVFPKNVHQHAFIRNASQKCGNNDTIRLTFLIKSALGNSHRRDVIRRTWASEKRFSDVGIRRIFLLGKSADNNVMKLVDAEAAFNDDIAQADFNDNYFNNTIKTVLGMRWALEYCSNSQHFMFVDDDYYISLKNTLRFLKNPLSYPNVLMKTEDMVQKPSGYSDTSSGKTGYKLFAGFAFQTYPHRHRWSKWFTPLHEYPFSMWPPYITAGAFILSREALLELYNASLNTRPFRFDDVYLGILALKTRIPLTHCEMFYFYKPKYTGPESYRYVIASHGFEDTLDMERVWTECRSAGFS